MKIEMRKPTPNFLEIRGVRVQCKYRGVKRVRVRCDQAGHNVSECSVSWYARSQNFTHKEECDEGCRRCGGSHATAACLRPRCYAEAVGAFPASPTNAARKMPEPEVIKEPPTLTPPPSKVLTTAFSSSEQETELPSLESDSWFFDVLGPLSFQRA